MRITKEVEIEVPAVPNFLSSKTGFEALVPVWELSSTQLEEVGRLWTAKLIKHAAETLKLRSK